MNKTIVGLEVVNYKSAKTQKQVNGVTLYLSSKNASVYGVKTSDLYLSSDKPVFQQLTPYIAKPDDLIGVECEVEYNEKGYLENFTLEV